MPKVSARDYHGILFFFVILMAVSTLHPLYIFVFDADHIITDIGKGKAIPSPISHIRYSLFLAFAILSSGILLVRRFYLKWKLEKYLLIFLLIYLVLFIHLFSVRSGLVVLYAGTMTLIVAFIRQKKGIKWIIIPLAMMILLPVMAYHFMPSFHKKVDYMRWDYKMYKEGKGHLYADGRRIQSYVVGWEVFKSNPIFGVGIGDANDACNAKYDEIYSIENSNIYPHNQYLFNLVSLGIFGCLIYFFGLLAPWILKRAYRNPFLSMIYLILLISFLVENTLERSVSIGFFLFFILLSLRYEDDQIIRSLNYSSDSDKA